MAAPTPDQLRRILEPLWGRALEVEAHAALIGRGEVLSEKALDKLRALLRGEITALETEGVQWVERYIPQLYEAGVGATDEAVGARQVGKLSAVAHRRAEEQLVGELRDTVEAACKQADRAVGKIAREYAETILHRTFRAGETVPVRNPSKLLEAARQGRILCYRDDSGRAWGLAPHIRLNTQTATRDAVAAGTRNRMREYGLDLARISTHNDPCPYCAIWEGRLISVDGMTPGYPTLDYAREMKAFHHNCYHNYQPVTLAEARSDDDLANEQAEIAAAVEQAKADYPAWQREAQAAVERRRAEAMAARE